MQKIYSNLKKRVFKLKVTNLDDLWFLSGIIEKNDLISGKTLRKIKKSEKDERKQIVSKKEVFMSLKVENVEFHKYSTALRVSGKITEAPEDIPKGSFHTFNIEENTIITLSKENWFNYQLKKIDEACAQKAPPILIVVHDREDAYFALLKKFGYTLLSKITGDVEKKNITENTPKRNFYLSIIEIIKEYDQRFNFQNIIVASPAFWKEELLKYLKDDDLKKKIVVATCSSVGENGIDEVLKRDEVKEVLRQDRISKEIKLVEELLKEISKNNLGVYGLNETKNAVQIGALRTLLITDSFIRQKMENNCYKEVDLLLKNTEQMKGDVHIISSEHDGGRKLDGLGGIGGLLRYKLNY